MRTICVLEATGQQIMDALEWGARSLPGESGAFLQISGLSYEIDVSTECEYLQGLCLEPQRRSAGENLTPGTVAVLVYADGTEEIIKTSVTSENGVVLTLDGSATVKIVDNTKVLADVDADAWYADAAAWAASREIMVGTGAGFAPETDTSRGMFAQLLFNLDGAQLMQRFCALVAQ